eukprot:568347_1
MDSTKLNTMCFKLSNACFLCSLCTMLWRFLSSIAMARCALKRLIGLFDLIPSRLEDMSFTETSSLKLGFVGTLYAYWEANTEDDVVTPTTLFSFVFLFFFRESAVS